MTKVVALILYSNLLWACEVYWSNFKLSRCALNVVVITSKALHAWGSMFNSQTDCWYCKWLATFSIFI